MELDEQLLFQKLSKPNDSYEILKRKISDETISAIKSLKESGIGIDNETLRYYPEGLYLSPRLLVFWVLIKMAKRANMVLKNIMTRSFPDKFPAPI